MAPGRPLRRRGSSEQFLKATVAQRCRSLDLIPQCIGVVVVELFGDELSIVGNDNIYELPCQSTSDFDRGR